MRIRVLIAYKKVCYNKVFKAPDFKEHQVGLVVSMSASHAVGCRFAPWLGDTKDHKNVTNCITAWHAGIRVGVWQCSLTV